MTSVTSHTPNQVTTHFDDVNIGGSSFYPEAPTVESADASAASSYTMMVATSVQDGRVERKPFPYWSWVPCLMCNRPRPPRCHHCTICRQCVLKRDHHCYFIRACVGVNNQRYFLFYLFWCILLIVTGISHLGKFYLDTVLPVSSVWDLFIPFNVVHVFTGQLSVSHLYFISVLWGVCLFLPIAVGMFSFGLYLTMLGLTKFEKDHVIKVKDTRTVAARVQATLGRKWGVTLLFPLCASSTVTEDAVNWPFIKT